MTRWLLAHSDPSGGGWVGGDAQRAEAYYQEFVPTQQPTAGYDSVLFRYWFPEARDEDGYTVDVFEVKEVDGHTYSVVSMDILEVRDTSSGEEWSDVRYTSHASFVSVAEAVEYISALAEDYEREGETFDLDWDGRIY